MLLLSHVMIKLYCFVLNNKTYYNSGFSKRAELP